jgi:hypothetical protein
LTLPVTCFLILFLSGVEHATKHCPKAHLRTSASQVVLGIRRPLAPVVTAPREILHGGNFSRLKTLRGNLKNIHKAFSQRLVGFEVLSHLEVEMLEPELVDHHPQAAIINMILHNVERSLALKD